MTLTVYNKSSLPLLFSVFGEGDNGIPYYTKWIDGGDNDTMDTGGFSKVSVGMQAQEGGRWIGKDPKYTKFNPDDEINATCALEPHKVLAD